MMGLVLKWIENDVGGLANMERRNVEKAQLLYNFLDASDFFHNPVNKPDRSIMNVVFTSPTPELDKKFCAEAAEAGLVNLKGHRSVGGMRASIYNAMPKAGVEKLVEFMADFAARNG
jgi:phosphoserine aminotransferase